MSIPRKTVLLRIAGLSARIEEHLEKMRSQPFAVDYNHWRHEAENWCTQLERVARHAGRRTQMEVMNRVAQWKQALAAAHE